MYKRQEQKQEIYISAEGYTFPCCWLAGQPFKWWKEEKKGDVHNMIGDYDKINLKKVRNLREIVEGDFFNRVTKSWSGSDRLETCALKCNQGYDPFSAQWQ